MKRKEIKARRYSKLFSLIKNYIFDSLCIDTIKYEYTYIIGWILCFVYVISVGFRICNRSNFHFLEIIACLLIVSGLVYLGRRYGRRVEVNSDFEPSDIDLQFTLDRDLSVTLINSGVNITDTNEIVSFIKKLIRNHEKKNR